MSTYKNRTTPGVYVTEFSAFPNSIPGVATAIPAFIGYTEKCEVSGKPAFFTPFLINSLADYKAIFGDAFNSVYDMSETDPDKNAVTADNCDFSADIWDATSSKYVTKYYVYTREKALFSPMTADIDLGKKAGLPTYNLYDCLRMFYANGGGTCYVVSVGAYSADGTISYDDLSKGLTAVSEQVGPTMLVIPDAVLLPADQPPATPPPGYMPTSEKFQQLSRDMLAQCTALQDRVAILDVYGTQALNPKSADYNAQLSTIIENFQKAVGDAGLSYGMSYFPFLITSIIQPGEITYLNFDTSKLEEILKSEASYLYPSTDSTKQGPVNDDNPTYLMLKGWIEDTAKPEYRDVTTDAGWSAITKLNQNLVNGIPLYQQMSNVLAYIMCMLPPSGTMAGIFTANDATRGVWNAPANVVLNSVVQPSVKLNGAQQGPLNVPINGKAIDVIRDFVGRGPVVWGARTLDGNSRDYRYIQVRRTLIYCETSIKTALNQFVFAPNDGKTWVAVVAMVSAFLQNLWAQGGLMGNKPDEAFSVQCGLGSTMTAMDVLDGYMIVQVTLQMIRPAEFIELTFKQKMEGMS
ncbi:phage tail sheath family protein [Bradyrhizobium prioriisuperbiae]|uniref:phage tail sheath family protein n=1 Tax=Bradyrhizobium prioriisuperbiae TaxID=2854389 RepID=UPI0028E71BB4|nr:phage tail sheath C-terminal domain-containing protein [Bradyrhizobium prioritasuperba]